MAHGESFDTEVKPSIAVADVKAAAAVADYEAVVNEARDASDLESNMSLKEALRCYPKAVFWSLCLSTAIIMEGFGECTLTSRFPLRRSDPRLAFRRCRPPRLVLRPPYLRARLRRAAA